jgi:hypothetical protein
VDDESVVDEVDVVVKVVISISVVVGPKRDRQTEIRFTELPRRVASKPTSYREVSPEKP